MSSRHTTYRYICWRCQVAQCVDVDAWTLAVQVLRSAAFITRTIQCDHCRAPSVVTVSRNQVSVTGAA
jgi:hypothetical protein